MGETPIDAVKVLVEPVVPAKLTFDAATGLTVPVLESELDPSIPKTIPVVGTFVQLMACVPCCWIVVHELPDTSKVAALYVPAAPLTPTPNLLKFTIEPPVPTTVAGTVEPFQMIALTPPVVVVLAVVVGTVMVRYKDPDEVSFTVWLAATVKNLLPEPEEVMVVNDEFDDTLAITPAEPEIVKALSAVSLANEFKFKTPVPPDTVILVFLAKVEPNDAN